MDNTKLFISIDTEEDAWKEYGKSKNRTENLKQLPRLQELFDRYDAIPTYLINYPVIMDTWAQSFFKKLLEKRRCEIGTHCHPWNTPPIDPEGEKVTMLCNLSPMIIRKKLKTLHRGIIEKIGVEPVTFRSGRWAYGSNVIQCLSELGYRIDTSVVPFSDWSKKKGPDFSEAQTKPYWINCSEITSNKGGQILEIPITAGFCQKRMQTAGRIRGFIQKSFLKKTHILGILDKLDIMRYRWLSPEVSSGEEMIKLANNFIATGHSYLNLTFHSNSLLPGCNPFVKDEDRLENFYEQIRIFLEFANNKHIDIVPLKSALDDFTN